MVHPAPGQPGTDTWGGGVDAALAGLGTASTKNVGTAAGTVAAGDDSRITSAATAASVTAEASMARSAANLLSDTVPDARLAAAIQRRPTYAGTETALVGTNPPAGTAIVTKQFTFTANTSGTGGGFAGSFPTGFPNGLCGVVAFPINGAALLALYLAGTNLSGAFLMAFTSSGAAVASGTAVTASLIAWGW